MTYTFKMPMWIMLLVIIAQVALGIIAIFVPLWIVWVLLPTLFVGGIAILLGAVVQLKLWTQ